MPAKYLFLFGVIHRSGSNYLHRLLSLHPQIGRISTIREDFLTANSDLLDQYVKHIAEEWNDNWDPAGKAANRLRNHLGIACLNFLQDELVLSNSDNKQVLLTKSPTCRNIRHFNIFPESKAVVIVRDGRSTIESGIRSFGWDLETKAREWRARGEELLEAARLDPNIMIVRYEDLLLRKRETLSRILQSVRLTTDKIDDKTIDSVPIVGSSDTKSRDGAIHWNAVPSYKEFTPLERWKDWSDEQHVAFNSIAGDISQQLGYRLLEVRN